MGTCGDFKLVRHSSRCHGESAALIFLQVLCSLVSHWCDMSVSFPQPPKHAPVAVAKNDPLVKAHVSPVTRRMADATASWPALQDPRVTVVTYGM